MLHVKNLGLPGQGAAAPPAVVLEWAGAWGRARLPSRWGGWAVGALSHGASLAF